MRDRDRLFNFYPITSQQRVWDTDVNCCCVAIIPQSVIAVFLLLCKYLLDAALQILQLMYIDVSTLYQNGS